MRSFTYAFLIFSALYFAMLVTAAYGQILEFTAQGSGYWQVMVNGEQVSQHTTEREAYERAANAAIMDANAIVHIVHNAVIDVEVLSDAVESLQAMQWIQLPDEVYEPASNWFREIKIVDDRQVPEGPHEWLLANPGDSVTVEY